MVFHYKKSEFHFEFNYFPISRSRLIPTEDHLKLNDITKNKIKTDPSIGKTNLLIKYYIIKMAQVCVCLRERDTIHSAHHPGFSQNVNLF